MTRFTKTSRSCSEVVLKSSQRAEHESVFLRTGMCVRCAFRSLFSQGFSDMFPTTACVVGLKILRSFQDFYSARARRGGGIVELIQSVSPHNSTATVLPKSFGQTSLTSPLLSELSVALWEQPESSVVQAPVRRSTRESGPKVGPALDKWTGEDTCGDMQAACEAA